jgi:tetratricopeptide (TPR) repeat protein
MKSLEPPDLHHLNAAEGWLGLGNALEAQRELEKIAPDMRHHPEVLRVKYHLHERARQWESAAATAQLLCQLFPETAFGWIHFAYALHELKRTQEAYDVLLPIVNRFPEEHVILYNLACYSCQMGRLEEARGWLDKAMALAGPETIKQMALADSDLQAMRAEIERM